MDIPNMLQRRYDDPMKRREVRRIAGPVLPAAPACSVFLTAQMKLFEQSVCFTQSQIAIHDMRLSFLAFDEIDTGCGFPGVLLAGVPAQEAREAFQGYLRRRWSSCCAAFEQGKLGCALSSSYARRLPMLCAPRTSSRAFLSKSSKHRLWGFLLYGVIWSFRLGN